ncbi:putative lipid II flippase FtsW [Thioalkalivibrio sp. HK1]|uniref:putative lipid II flippase FtsW n=1 Tax=Thioalkalivibrio sp. HK1 TaxID=1469245 RepID=UPI000472BE35|nr:putative lipid II flippase FtsW [Thioalkalivibrio sp. HK1]
MIETISTAVGCSPSKRNPQGVAFARSAAAPDPAIPASASIPLEIGNGFKPRSEAFWRHHDPLLWGVVATLTALGLVMVASASTAIAQDHYGDPLALFWRQSIHVLVGLAVMILVACLPLAKISRVSPLLLVVSMILLALVLIPGIGHEVKGSARWIRFGTFGIQPSEFAKVGVLLYFASYLSRRTLEVRSSYFGLFKAFIVILLVCPLLLAEPDYGATAVLVATAFGMLFLAGVPMMRFVIATGFLIAAMGMLALLAPYRVQRIMSFTDPFADPFGSGFQLVQALIAIGRGGFFGVGLGESVQKLFYLPEAHSDFLFSMMAEELGLVSMVVVVVLYTLFMLRSLAIGYRAQRSGLVFGAYAAWGIGLLIGIQAGINIGVNMGLLPTKGLTLPLMSYGGSSFLACAAGVGILARVERERRMLCMRGAS